MKSFFKKPELPKWGYHDAKLIMEKMNALYDELDKLDVHYHGIGASLDMKTLKPFVFVHLPPDFKMDLELLPKICSDVEIRYEKRDFATG